MPNLKEALALRADPYRCLFAQNDSGAFVEFHKNAHHRQGFPLSQLLHYTLEVHPDITDIGADAPAQRLTLAFSTADVTLTGWRLDKAADNVRTGSLSIVKALPGGVGYEQLASHACAVMKIEIELMGKTG